MLPSHRAHRWGTAGNQGTMGAIEPRKAFNQGISVGLRETLPGIKNNQRRQEEVEVMLDSYSYRKSWVKRPAGKCGEHVSN